MVVVYGTAYEHDKQEFIDELHAVMEGEELPLIIGGDFNLIRNVSEKNNENINYHWADEFNNWINYWGLVELKNPMRSYSWTNNQEEAPVMALLDRALVSTSLEAKYPLMSLRGAPRVGSDHVPILVDFGENAVFKQPIFRFEKWWLTQEDFLQVVRDSWGGPCRETNPLDIWHSKLKRLRKKLKGWSLNGNAALRQKKKALLEEFDQLDIMSEHENLTGEEKLRMESIQEELEGIWAVDEIKAKQRSRDRNIREGDRNTAYFQAIANQRKRKKNILALKGPNGLISENEEMLELAADFYKSLFGHQAKPDIHLDEGFWEEEKVVTPQVYTYLEVTTKNIKLY